jgi:molybdate transport system ATP-binding protein
MVEGPLSEKGLESRLDIHRGESFHLDVALAIPPGRTIALLGPNGSGKSTVVAALAGLLGVERGRIELASEILDDPEQGIFVPPERRSVGVMFQDYLLFPHLNVIDNVGFGLRSRGMKREESRARAEPWIERLGLRGLEKSLPAALSGGQAQRAALARALVIDPDLLLLDEPLSALDVTTRAHLRRGLADHLQAFAGPRLLITHDPTEAFLLGDEIHVVESGRITQIGTADEIRLRPRTPYAADLADSNLFSGLAAGGTVSVDSHVIHIAEPDLTGEVLVNIRPSAVAVYRSRPQGSPRNAWETVIEDMERLAERTRLVTGGPLPLTVEVTRAATEELELEKGSRIWVSIKATEIQTVSSNPEELK